MEEGAVGAPAVAVEGMQMGDGVGSAVFQQIPGLTQMLISEDPQGQFNATQAFRKLL